MSRQEVVDGIRRKVRARDLRTLLAGHCEEIKIELPYKLSVELQAREKALLVAEAFINDVPNDKYIILPTEVGLVYSRVVTNNVT